ncbi:MAG: LysM peptidoglycan-binding domain-containing protein, partial [SAR324 cluster bacterium]|nr:LysM peptidoglycan-binding domain-containing protein [SAR324 cluster bacterium]
MGNTPCFASICSSRVCSEWGLGKDTKGFYMSLVKRTVFFMLLILSSCSKRELEPPREIPLPKEPAAIYHEVLFHGETLSLIAAWYTGDSKNWKTIADFNPGLNPNNISIRDIIKIPKSIVKREKSFTQSELQAMKKSMRKKPSLLERSINPQNSLDADSGTAETYGEKEQYEGG